jgi:hypothetical protein
MENLMKKRAALLAVILLILLLGVTGAGTAIDVGAISNSPPPIGEVNWVAWLQKNVQAGGYPSEILTEDNTNNASGPNNGYSNFGSAPNPKWVLQVENFTNNATGDQVHILLGGIGSSSGNGWQYSFNWFTGESVTQHPFPTPITNFSACPIMGPGSQSDTGKTVNWTGNGASQYHIYRSQNASGFTDGQGRAYSNGRYFYVATVDGSTFTYQDTVCGTGSNCWHIVVPADSSGNINGCHSETTGPTAVSMQFFRPDRNGNNTTLIIAGMTFVFLVLVSVVFLGRRRLNQ